MYSPPNLAKHVLKLAPSTQSVIAALYNGKCIYIKEPNETYLPHGIAFILSEEEMYNNPECLPIQIH
jgi:hypothetical protein